MRQVSVGLGLLALVLGLATLSTKAAPPGSSAGARIPVIHHKSRSFRIPFNVDPAERPRLKEVQLWVSTDEGYTWNPNTSTTPDRPYFTFRATEDDEYWFAVRTLDLQGRLYPGDDEQVEPSMKVVVDSKPPTLILEGDGRRGSVVSVRWEMHDEVALVPGSLVIEYQLDGANKWKSVPIDQLRKLGSVRWDAGTAEPLNVRAQVEDRAGNVASASIVVPSGTPTRPEGSLTAQDGAQHMPPPALAQEPTLPPDFAGEQAFQPRESFPPTTTPVSNRREPSDSSSMDEIFTGSGQSNPRMSTPDPQQGNPAQTGSKNILTVATTQFPLRYEVEDAGPDGPNSVELFYTRDSGRSWIPLGSDEDRVTPFQVSLPGEGIYGLYLVARSSSGLGDRPPAPNDPPQVWVEVDTTPPTVVMVKQPIVGMGKYAGKVAITWKVSDNHLTATPVTLFWRSDKPGEEWKPIGPSPLPPTPGQFIWTVPPDVPARIHIKIEAVDTVGNVASVDTMDSGPILVDRSRPKSKILGLDPAALPGSGAQLKR